MPSFLEQARIYAAVLQSAGFEAKVLPPPDKETIRLGEKNSSERECHPYAVIAGELIRFVRDASPSDGDVFLIPNCSAPCLAGSLWEVPRTSKPGTLPVVGVTGDLYTRMNPAGNAGPFRRLEQMGCEVWPSPFFATFTELLAALNFHTEAGRARIKDAAFDGLTWALVSGVRYRLVRRLPEEIVTAAVEPPVDELIRLAKPYVGPRTNYLILQVVAKAVDFLRRGAAGVISAAGINCMVGTAASSFLPAVRADFRQAPAITLFYGGAEGPAQRVRLETFVHQVRQRWKKSVA